MVKRCKTYDGLVEKCSYVQQQAYIQSDLNHVETIQTYVWSQLQHLVYFQVHWKYFKTQEWYFRERNFFFSFLLN